MTGTGPTKTQKTRPAGTLKKLVDAGKRETRVLTSLERFVLAQPMNGDRATNVIHPSAMIKSDWCHRAEYYTLQGAKPAPSKFKASIDQMLVFEEGHRIHDRYQTWFWGMGNLYGLWQCQKDESHTFWALSPTQCEACGNEKLKYREVPVSSLAHGISGHADGWIVGLGEDLLLEIKSVGEGTFRWEDPTGWIDSGNDFKKYWSELKNPFYSHLMQAQVYMKLLEIMDPTNFPKEAVFVYESKVDQKRKEFVVSKSDFGVTELFDSASMIMQAVKDQVPPTCNINPFGSCYKCEVHNVD